MNLDILKYLQLAAQDPKTFAQKAWRRCTLLKKNYIEHFKLLTTSPKIYDFCSNPIKKPTLFKLDEAWSMPQIISHKEIEALLRGELNIFGHTTIVNTQNPRWHDDLRLPENENPQHNQTFSLNIRPTESSSPVPHVFGYDIKYPWERSRLQHLIPLGQAYAADRNNNRKILEFFKSEINSWITHNPFMRGVNWMNAMEVGIRASNLIWLFEFFYSEKAAENDPFFWNLYINMLVRHSEFIHSHWEDFDKPNNHYLLNLTGAWYLATFFKHFHFYPFGKLTVLWEKICTGFNHQISNDGTSYEGSTSYHGFIIQALRHIERLGKITDHELPYNLTKKLYKGVQFLADCRDTSAQRVQLGDNDSGYLVAPLQIEQLPDAFAAEKTEINPSVGEYPDFGCIFIMNKDWHISLRTKSFNETSPRGHFHQDLLSITASYKGIPFIVDSGTGCYTANTTTRNMLRSWAAHSNVHPQTSNTQDLADLFDLKSEIIISSEPLIAGSQNAPTITAQYKTSTLSFTRSVKLNGEQNVCTITDVVERLSGNQTNLESSLIFAAEVIAHQTASNTFELQNKDQILVLEHSMKHFVLNSTVISPAYGELTRSTKLSTSLTTPHHSTLKLTPKI